MRVIKFRGFHADEHGKTIIKLDGKEIRGFWCYGDLHTDGPYINEHKVLPETVGQFTGCADRNGREIFEGDIVEIVWSVSKRKNASVIVFVEYIKGAFYLKKDKEFGVLMAVYSGEQLQTNSETEEYIKVIGNIFENSELLEVKK